MVFITLSVLMRATGSYSWRQHVLGAMYIIRKTVVPVHLTPMLLLAN